MRVAIIHDVYIELGGAERVLHSLLKLYPQADVYVPLITTENRERVRKKTEGRIVSSLLNNIPFIHSASILLKPFLFWYWETLDLTEYEVVISSSHSFSSKSVITSPETLHLSYIHTSPRYLYTEFNETRILKIRWAKVLLAPLLSGLRMADYIGAQRPDVIVANSQIVQRRIEKYYRRSSSVIYPPVTMSLAVKRKQGRYFLAYSRLAKQKGIDLAVKACTKLKQPLVVVGTGSEEEYLRSIAGPSITFKGYVPDEGISEVFAHAKALLYCSVDEDFGMVPVEAMAHGVPVIAYNSGGVKETIISGKTGILFEEYSADGVIDGIKKFQNTTFNPAVCIKQAKLYSAEIFEKSILTLIKTELKKRGQRGFK
ncbi:MAG: glycosyltransferase [bacterium]|nr:glycosyltransferase [bacterium]